MTQRRHATLSTKSLGLRTEKRYPQCLGVRFSRHDRASWDRFCRIGVATGDGPNISCLPPMHPPSGELVTMRTGQDKARLGPGLRRYWRWLVGVAVVYAIVMQPLLLSVAGTQMAQAAALDDLTLSQLCLHSPDGSPLSPDDQSKHPAHHHCSLCFSGAFQLLDGPRPVSIALFSLEFRKIRQSAFPLRLSSFSRYSVARPRGPPLSA
jgi:hypothetical protein